MSTTGYQLRPRHLCSMAAMTLAAFAALSQQSSASAGTGPVSTDALARPQAPAAIGHQVAPARQISVSQRLRAYEAKERPYVPKHVRRHIYPVAVEQPVQRSPAPARATSETPAPAPTRQAPAAAPVTASGSPQQYAESLVGSAQFACLDPLWERESGWNPLADNPGSGAYGIPQSLPGDKMASAGPDWQTDADTQIRWGIQYLDDTYGSACGGWAHEEADGWYLSTR